MPGRKPLDDLLCMRFQTCAFCLISSALLYGGCRGKPVDLVSEEQEKHYLRGKSLLKEGRKQEALSAFLRVIEKRYDAAESHLETGQLYLNHIRDPIAAIFHFRKYLALKPDSPQARLVRQLIDTAKKEFARTLPAKPFENELERLDLMELINQVKSENLVLKRQLFQAKQRIRELSKSGDLSSDHNFVSAAENAHDIEGGDENSTSGQVSGNDPIPATYLVQPGDNLNRISIKVYGTSGRWMDIYQANRDRLASPHDLKVDQELRLP